MPLFLFEMRREFSEVTAPSEAAKEGEAVEAGHTK